VFLTVVNPILFVTVKITEKLLTATSPNKWRGVRSNRPIRLRDENRNRNGICGCD